MKKYLLATLIGAFLSPALFAQTFKPGLPSITPKLKSVKVPDYKDLHKTGFYFSANKAVVLDAEAIKKQAEASIFAPVEKAGSTPQLKIRRITRQDVNKKEKLDSVVATNIKTGEPYSLQTYEYDQHGWPLKCVKSTWDATAKKYVTAETDGYTLDEDGYILSEWIIYDAYGYGQRNDYTYNDQKLGISQINYSYDTATKEWTPTGKGEYKYDDRGYMIEEHIYTYDADKKEYVPTSWNKAAWDDRGLQTLIEPYTWNGTEWVGDEKLEYDWLDAGHMKSAKCYMWIPESKSWFHYINSTMDFNDRIQLTRYEKAFWNKKLQNWSGCEEYYGALFQNILDSTFYDNKGRMTYDVAYSGLTTDGYTKGADIKYDITDYEDGGWQSVATTTLYPENKVTNITTDKYNADGYLLFQNEKVKDDQTGKMLNYTETEYAYDENNRLTSQLDWTYNQDEANARLSNIASYYTYDSYGNPIEGLFKNGTAMQGLTSGEDWVNYSKFTYRYEQDSICVNKTKYLWDGSDWVENEKTDLTFDYSTPVASIVYWPGTLAFHKVDKDEEYTTMDEYTGYVFKFYYSDFTPASIASQSLNRSQTVQVYPHVITGDFTVTAPEGTRVEVYDICGKLIKRTAPGTIDAAGMPAGMYIVKAGGQAVKVIRK